MIRETERPKHSFSSVNTFIGCPFKYKLIYMDGHYIKSDTVATEFGTLIHHIEEQLGIFLGYDRKDNEEVDYDFYKNLFINIDEEKVSGVRILKEKYADAWLEPDKQGFTYEDKVNAYLEFGIYRLENFLKDNPTYVIAGLEVPFTVEIGNKLFGGFIDRVFKDTLDGTFIVEDIKTFTKLLKLEELSNATQMFIYTQALKQEALKHTGKEIHVRCYYNLPLINSRQQSLLDYEKMEKELVDTVELIYKGDFYPNPTPLCHWCVFSQTFPNQPEEAKGLCPYFSHWTQKEKTKEVENNWQGESMHEVILEEFRNKIKKD